MICINDMFVSIHFIDQFGSVCSNVGPRISNKFEGKNTLTFIITKQE